MPRSATRRSAEPQPNAWLRARLEQAIVDLARTRPADELTVRAICARAGVGRHTFFQVFASVGEAKAAAQRRSR